MPLQHGSPWAPQQPLPATQPVLQLITLVSVMQPLTRPHVASLMPGAEAHSFVPSLKPKQGSLLLQPPQVPVPGLQVSPSAHACGVPLAGRMHLKSVHTTSRPSGKQCQPLPSLLSRQGLLTQTHWGSLENELSLQHVPLRHCSSQALASPGTRQPLASLTQATRVLAS